MASSACRTSLLLVAALVVASCDRGAPAPDASGPAAPSAASSTDTGAAAAPAPAATPVTLAAHAAPAPAAGGNCALDSVNGGAVVNTPVVAGSEVSLSGWVASPQNTVPSDAMLVLTGAGASYAGALAAGIDRPDVATALGSEAARMSGFSALVSLAGVEPGDYVVSVVQGGAAPVACAFNKTLVVASGG